MLDSGQCALMLAGVHAYAWVPMVPMDNANTITPQSHLRAKTTQSPPSLLIIVDGGAFGTAYGEDTNAATRRS